MKKINNKGITLIELIVSFAIVGVAIIYFFQTLYTVKKVYNTARNETNNYVAVNYAFRNFDAALDNGIDIDTFKSKFGIDVEAVDTSSNLQHYKLTINGTKKDFYKYVTNSSSGTTDGSTVITKITSEEDLNKYLSEAYKTECQGCLVNGKRASISYQRDVTTHSDLKLDFGNKKIIFIKLKAYSSYNGDLKINSKNNKPLHVCSVRIGEDYGNTEKFFDSGTPVDVEYKDIEIKEINVRNSNVYQGASCTIEIEKIQVEE